MEDEQDDFLKVITKPPPSDWEIILNTTEDEFQLFLLTGEILPSPPPQCSFFRYNLDNGKRNDK